MTRRETTWATLLQSWERVRRVNTGGFAQSNGTNPFLIGIDWIDDQSNGPNADHSTSCSPCVCQVLVMAFASAEELSAFDANPGTYRFCTFFPKAFSHAVNSRLNNPNATMLADLQHARDHGFQVDEHINTVQQAIEAYELGQIVPTGELKRGDVLAITALPTAAHPHGRGHCAFAWDVHYDVAGVADAVLILAANGSDSVGAGMSVAGNPGALISGSGTAPHAHYAAPDPYFLDSRAEIWVGHGSWLTWHDPATVDFSGWNIPLSRIRQIQSLHAARLNGVIAPASMCMSPSTGAAATMAPPPAPPHVPDVTPVAAPRAEVHSAPAQVATRTRSDAVQRATTLTDGQLRIEQQLRILHDHHWLDTDPGQLDGINDCHTQDALRDFQRRYFPGFRTDGTADAATRRHLRLYATRAAHGGPPPDRPTPPRPAASPAVTALTWRHGSAYPGDDVDLIVDTVAAEGRSITVRFKRHDDGTALGAEATMVVSSDSMPHTFHLADICGAVHSDDVFQVDATVSGVGADFTTGAPLNVQPDTLIVPRGKGSFMYFPSGSAASVRVEHNLRRARQAQSMGLKWMIIEGYGPGQDGLVQIEQDRMNDAVTAYRQCGVDVWIWGWPGRPTRGNESVAIDALARLARDSHARGIIVDVEEEYGRPPAHPLDTVHLQAIADRLTQVVSDGGLGVGVSTYIPAIAEALAIPGSFLSPQWYHPHVYHLPNVCSDMMRYARQYRKIVPTIPVWLRFQDDTRCMSPADLTLFLQELDRAAGEHPHVVPAVCSWVWDNQTHPQDHWLPDYARPDETHAQTNARWLEDHVAVWQAWVDMHFTVIPNE